MKTIEIGYDEKILFHLRMCSVSEEMDLVARFGEILESDEQKYEKQFELYRGALAEFSEQMPQKLVKEKGEMKRVPLVEGAETPTQAIEAYFKERTIELERIAREAYFFYRSMLVPPARFLQSSGSL